MSTKLHIVGETDITEFQGANFLKTMDANKVMNELEEKGYAKKITVHMALGSIKSYADDFDYICNALQNEDTETVTQWHADPYTFIDSFDLNKIQDSEIKLLMADVLEKLDSHYFSSLFITIC